MIDKKVTPIPFKHVLRDPKELKPAEYNPRKIKGKELDDLTYSINTFGILEPTIVNIADNRKNIIIGGHQRNKIYIELGFEKIPVIELDLTFAQEKELNIRLNKSGGKFDESILKEYYTPEDLLDFGFIKAETDKIFNADILKDLQNEEEAIFPIVPEFSEKYDYVIILATNEIDNAFLNSFFNIPKQQSYKNSRIGVGKVVRFEEFKKIVKNED